MQPSNGNTARYGIEELAELGGVSRRTVRYYVQRGLLPAPTGTGRGQHYTEAHLRSLERIRQLQESGVPLSEIPRRLDPDAAPPPEPAAPALVEAPSSHWTRIVLADGVELHLRGRLDAAQARQLAETVLTALGHRTQP